MQERLRRAARRFGAAIALLLSTGQGMADMRFTPLPVPEARFAYRAVFVTPDRLVLGSMDQNAARILLHVINGKEAVHLDTIGLLLPALADFDLAPVQGGLLAAVERHGGATSIVGFIPLAGALSAPETPAADLRSNQRRPRFVRGAAPTTVVGDTGTRTVLLHPGNAPRRSLLCEPCTNAIAVATRNGLAVVSKTEKSGPPMGDVRGGTLGLTWPSGDGAPGALLGGKTVFDYDVVSDGDSILLAAVVENALLVVRVQKGGAETMVARFAFAENWEPFSPTLGIGPKGRRLAVLVTGSTVTAGANQLWIADLP